MLLKVEILVLLSFPHAEVKVFLTANAEARAHRRAVQRDGGNAAQADKAVNSEEEKQILANIERRDKMDSTRRPSPRLLLLMMRCRLTLQTLRSMKFAQKSKHLSTQSPPQNSSEGKTPQKAETLTTNNQTTGKGHSSEEGKNNFWTNALVGQYDCRLSRPSDS